MKKSIFNSNRLKEYMYNFIKLILLTMIVFTLIVMVLQILIVFQLFCLLNTFDKINNIDNELMLSIVNFVTTTILSILVYSLSKKNHDTEHKQACCNVIAYFETSLNTIKNFNEKVCGDLNLYSQPIQIYSDLIKMNLNNNDLEILKDCYMCIEKIRFQNENNKDTLGNLCDCFIKEQYEKTCEIICKIKKSI